MITLSAIGGVQDARAAVRELYLVGMTLPEARRLVACAVAGGRPVGSFRMLGADMAGLADRLGPGGFGAEFET